MSSMKTRSLAPACAACRRGCGGAGRDSLPARDKFKSYGGPGQMAHLAGSSDQWSLKTVWGVGYKFEVVSQ
jgi:hypothetical protein